MAFWIAELAIGIVPADFLKCGFALGGISGVAESLWRFDFSSTDSTLIRTCARPAFSHAGSGDRSFMLPSAQFSMSVSSYFIGFQVTGLKERYKREVAIALAGESSSAHAS